MKISIGAKIKEGPWGGGNLFFINLRNFLLENSHDVVFDLNSDDIDVILLTDPRFLSESSSFDHRDIKLYKKFVNPNVKVVHRINECDERKNTLGLNAFFIKASKVADKKVFVSSWLKRLYENEGIESQNNHVILSGSDKSIFNKNFKEKWNRNEPLKIVTHHWGANWNKGFESYSKLDDLLDDKNFRKKYSFTYIGNLPNRYFFKNATHLQPLSGLTLSKELQKHDLYITGSLNEPSGNHHIEGALCGLPILFLDSGGITEYAKNFGVEFNLENIQNVLEEIRLNYDKYYNKMNDYPFNSNRMCEEYMNLFNEFELNNNNVKNKNKLFNFLFRFYLQIKLILKKLITNDW